ncbi:MAG: transglutaminase-like domain-containing protein [Halobacteriota archaeon]
MREELWKIPAFILMVISLSLLISFTSTVDLSKTGFSGFIGAGNDKAEDIPQKIVPVSYDESDMNDLNEESDPPEIPVFFVDGLNEHTYLLRLYTASTYSDGKWGEDNVTYDDKKTLGGTTITSYSVTPLSTFSRHIPVAKDTFFVTASADYNEETGIYLVDNLSTGYRAYSSARDFQAEDAASNNVDVDVYGRDAIRHLTLRVTDGAKNDYEKAVMIQEYLQDNYVYDTAHWTSPHPVHDFLFKEEKGLCKHFASAFIIMCRSIDIQARGVFGYLAKPVGYNQTVYASQAHMWAEVKFEENWKEFNPTPPPPDKLPTETEIDVIDETAERGSNFTVGGFVESEHGVPSGYVEIYLKKDKNEEGLLVDLIPVENGRFKRNVTVPDISGEYHVVAHYVGTLRYDDSWSDPIIRIYDTATLEADIPDITSRDCQITGSLHDYNGTAISNAPIHLKTIKLEQSGRVKVQTSTYRTETSAEGTFQFDVNFKEHGEYIVNVSYPGGEYLLPSSVEKEVEVGDVGLYLNNTYAVRGEYWNTSGIIYFNERPLNSMITFKGLTTTMAQEGEFDVSTRIPSDSPLGRTKLRYEVSDLNYRSFVNLTVKAKTDLDVEVKKDKNWVVFVYVKDDNGDPVSGEISIANNTVFAQEGVAKLESEELPEKFQVVFPGNEKYLASSIIVDRTTFPYWTLVLLVPIAAFAAYKMRFQKLIVVEWGSDLPPVWDVGEEVNINVSLKNGGKSILRASLDGKGLEVVGKSLNLNFVFPEPGNHTLVAERFLPNGKVKETRQVEIKIMSYSDAIIDIFGELVKVAEDKKNINLRDATAREVFNAIGTSDGRELLNLFEYAKYGDEEYTRVEFSIAYHAYMNICREIA